MAASGSLLMIHSPSGRPMIVALSAQATTERIPASHQPTRMNQITRRIRFGGLTSTIWTRDADRDPHSLMSLRIPWPGFIHVDWPLSTTGYTGR